MQLKSVALLFGIKDFADEQATLLATWIYDNYQYDQLSLIQKVLTNPPADKDAQWRLTPDTVARWMKIALERKAERIENYVHNKKNELPEPVEIPELKEETVKMIEEAKANMIQKSSIPKLTADEVLKEGKLHLTRTQLNEIRDEYGLTVWEINKLYDRWLQEEKILTFSEWLLAPDPNLQDHDQRHR